MAFFLLLSLACIYYAKSHESQCMYQYLEQPPLDIICDPYNPQSTGLSLQCQVLALGPSSSYSVGWFYSPTSLDVNQTVEPTLLSVTSTVRDYVNSATSTTTVTLTLRPPVDASSPGFYYCQVLPVDQSETIPSNNFTLYAPEDNHYLTFIICDATKPRFKSEVKCAVPMGMNITGDPADVTTGNDIATKATSIPTQGDQPTRTANDSTGTSLLRTEINPTTVTCADSRDDGSASKAMLYQIYVFVLTPIFLLILIVLITTVAVCLGRKCARRLREEQEEQKKTEENNYPIRDRGGLNQLRQSFHRVLGMQPRTTVHTSSPLSSLDLQPNPSYLENSRNTALLQSRPYQASPLLEAQRQVQKPEPCRRDITRQEEDVFPDQGSITSYEDNSYVIMRSSGTNSTYQSSGAYESML